MNDNGSRPAFEMPSEQESVRILDGILTEMGIEHRPVRPGERGGFFIKDENGGLERYEPKFGDIFPDAPIMPIRKDD